MNEDARTNNASEGFHTRFSTLVGRDHPNFYKFLASLVKEQDNTEKTLTQMDLGQLVKRGKTQTQQKREDKILNIVRRYDEFRTEGQEMRYLDCLGYYVNVF